MIPNFAILLEKELVERENVCIKPTSENDESKMNQSNKIMDGKELR